MYASNKPSEEEPVSDESKKPSEGQRVNIYMPTQTLQFIDDKAAKYYQGNRSQLIRSAVYFYAKFLEDGTTLGLEKIELQLGEVSQAVNKLAGSNDSIAENMEEVEAHLDPKGLMTDNQSQKFVDARAVQEVINESDDGRLSEEGIIEQTNLPPQRVKISLETLLDLGIITMESNEDTQIYQLSN